jgi:hypothetical protein
MNRNLLHEIKALQSYMDANSDFLKFKVMQTRLDMLNAKLKNILKIRKIKARKLKLQAARKQLIINTTRIFKRHNVWHLLSKIHKKIILRDFRIFKDETFDEYWNKIYISTIIISNNTNNFNVKDEHVYKLVRSCYDCDHFLTNKTYDIINLSAEIIKILYPVFATVEKIKIDEILSITSKYEIDFKEYTPFFN